MKKYYLFFILTGILFSSCMTQEDPSVLVSYYPAQCYETPWESRWIEENDKVMADWYELTEDQQLDIIENFVETVLNVNVLQIDHYPLPEGLGVRPACGYPRGDHYELQVSENDLNLMQFNGFLLIE